ncbi:MAG: hypothetical protein ACREEM_24410 [Blastocatellia bacterium]
MNQIARRASTCGFTSHAIHNRALFCAAAAALICALFPSLTVLGSDPLRYRPGLRNSSGKEMLNDKQLDAVLRHLREKTGFAEMQFDGDGFLSLGDRTNFTGGSETARQALIAAVDMKGVVELETAPLRSKVTFARTANLITFQNRTTGQRIDTCSIQIDFADFSLLRGDRQAIAAFDLGFVLLHELGHAALGLRDTYDGSPGDCEVMVNRVRRELNLPERQTYIAQVYQTVRSPSLGITKQAELIFTKNGGKAGDKLQKFHLNWEAKLVGPVTDGSTLSASKIEGANKGKPVAASIAGQ